MEQKLRFASKKSPMLVFLLMLCCLVHNFYLGKPFKGLLFYALAGVGILFDPASEYTINKTGNPTFEAVSLGIGAILLLSVVSDLVKLVNGNLKDGEGRFVTINEGCPNCGYLGDQNITVEPQGQKVLKVNKEEVVSKTYGDRGRLKAITKSVTKIDRNHKIELKTIECPYCNHIRKFEIATPI